MHLANVFRNLGLTALVAGAVLAATSAVPLIAEAVAPNRPHSLTGIAKHNQVELKWRAPSGGAVPDGYRIYRRDVSSQNAGAFTQLVSDTGNTNTTDTDMDTMTGKRRYVYRVSALDGSDESTGKTGYYHAIVSDVVRTDGEIWKSHSVEASVSGANAVLEWKVISTTGVTGYQILRKQVGADNRFEVLENDTGNRDRTYTDTNVQTDNTYSYRVKARYDHGGASGVGNATKYAKVTIP